MTGTDGEKIQVLHWHLAWLPHAVFLPLAPSLVPLASEPSLKSPWASAVAPSCSGCLSPLPLPCLPLIWHEEGISVLPPSVSAHIAFTVEDFFCLFVCFLGWFFFNSNKPVGL